MSLAEDYRLNWEIHDDMVVQWRKFSRGERDIIRMMIAFVSMEDIATTLRRRRIVRSHKQGLLLIREVKKKIAQFNE